MEVHVRWYHLHVGELFYSPKSEKLNCDLGEACLHYNEIDSEIKTHFLQ